MSIQSIRNEMNEINAFYSEAVLSAGSDHEHGALVILITAMRNIETKCYALSLPNDLSQDELKWIMEIKEKAILRADLLESKAAIIN